MVFKNEPTNGNYGFIEGANISGTPINVVDGTPWRSAGPSITDGEPRILTFLTIPSSVGGKAYARVADAEYRMLNRFIHDRFPNAVKEDVFPEVTGTLKIVSEKPYCESCSGAIHEFSNMFPNLNLILIDGSF